MKTKKFNNIIDLEMSLFKDLDMKEEEEGLNEDLRIATQELLCDNYEYNSDICLVVKILDNKAICLLNEYYNRKYLTFDNTLNVKVGDILLVSQEKYPTDNNDRKIVKIENSVVKKRYLDNKVDLCNSNGIKSEFSITIISNLKDGDVITKDLIENTIKKLIKKAEEEKEKQAEKDKEDEEMKKEELCAEKEKFEKESILLDDGGEVTITKNEMKVRGRKYVFEKSINKIFNYEETKYFSGWTGEIDIYDKVKEKKENYRVEEREDVLQKEEWVKIYGMEFEDDKVKINEVPITKSRIHTVINNVRKETTKEELELLSKLSIMKMDVLQTKNISCNGIVLDINFSLFDKDTFKVKFMKKTKKLSWDIIKKHLFYGRGINTNFSGESLINFLKKLGIKKQDFYSHLKKAVLIKSLEDESKNN